MRSRFAESLPSRDSDGAVSTEPRATASGLWLSPDSLTDPPGWIFDRPFYQPAIVPVLIGILMLIGSAVLAVVGLAKRRFLRMRPALAAFGAFLCLSCTRPQTKPIPIKVVVVTLCEIGTDTGDAPGIPELTSRKGFTISGGVCQ
jgi:hypothetical protein